jgi:hypothetical protein
MRRRWSACVVWSVYHVCGGFGGEELIIPGYFIVKMTLNVPYGYLLSGRLLVVVNMLRQLHSMTISVCRQRPSLAASKSSSTCGRHVAPKSFGHAASSPTSLKCHLSAGNT